MQIHHLECKSVISSARRKPTAKSRVVAQVYTPEEHSVEDTWKKGRQGTVPNTGQRAALLKKWRGDLAHYTNIHLYCYNFITIIMCFWFNGLRLWLKHIWSDYLPSSFPLLFYLLIIVFFSLAFLVSSDLWGSVFWFIYGSLTFCIQIKTLFSMYCHIFLYVIVFSNYGKIFNI